MGSKETKSGSHLVIISQVFDLLLLPNNNFSYFLFFVFYSYYIIFLSWQELTTHGILVKRIFFRCPKNNLRSQNYYYIA